ncbi:MAG: hypothetical protein IPJ65_35715 [Archangiaceae bacterium]|nr:hypothetical protein [Archangiaceae bacterium]
MFQLTATQLAILIAVSGIAGWLLRKNLWRAIVYLFPTSVLIDDDAPATAKLKLPDPLSKHAETLTHLGFTFIGTHLEHPRLGAAVLMFDYASEEQQAFASLFLTEDDEARVELLTPTEAGGFVRTANYRRTALEEKGYFSGYLDRVPLDRLLQAHQRTAAGVGLPRTQWDTAARLAAARAWYQSPSAARELRRQHQSGLVWTFGAVVSLGLEGLALATLVG